MEEDDFLMMGEFDEPEEPHEVVVARHSRHHMSQDDILRWTSWVKPFPLPDYLAPTDDYTLSDMDDETLLKVPPHLIVHVQRTAAQGGTQIVSPRQTPVTCLMGRVQDSRREMEDHVVGSVAANETVWPTVEPDDLDEWLPDEPLPRMGRDYKIREKTRTQPLTKANVLMKDPILACLIKGRATIDIMRRDDVGGDAEALTELLSDAWGVPKADLMEMDAYSLGIEGPLLRHAIKTDEVFPTVHAPIHKKLCISVGHTDMSRELLPEDTAMDWRRMRTVCEAIFLMSCSLEGISLTDVICTPPPGDPVAPTTRSNILAFRPLPCTAWTFEPKTFSICPAYSGNAEKQKSIPPDVLAAMSKYVREVRPVSFAMAGGHRSRAIRTTMSDPEQPTGEVLSSIYSKVARSVPTGSSRGRTAAAAMRNFIYDTLNESDLHVRLKIARYITIALDEVKAHLGDSIVPDEMIHSLAVKFVSLGELIRSKVVAESVRRGATPEDWWYDMCSQVPERYRKEKEGTMGWAHAGMWLLFRAPTDRWTKLAKATMYSALRDAEVSAIGSIPLPPEIGSTERVTVAVKTAAKRISQVYAGYYRAVADVAYSIAEILEGRRQQRSAATMRECAYLWTLRAGALRGTNLSNIAKDVPTPSPNHLRIVGVETDILVKPAPYQAFARYKGHVEVSEILPKLYKKAIAMFKGTKISRFFAECPGPILPSKESTVTRYLLNPSRLAADIERSWEDMKNDLSRVVRVYGCDERGEVRKRKQPEVVRVVMPDAALSSYSVTLSQKNFYGWMGDMDPDEHDEFERIFDAVGEAERDRLCEIEFESLEELRSTLVIVRDEHVSKKSKGPEVVR